MVVVLGLKWKTPHMRQAAPLQSRQSDLVFVFEIGSHCVPLAGLELAMYSILALNSYVLHISAS